MNRPITLSSGQFGDISLEKLCQISSSIGYDGLELATHAHFNVDNALQKKDYVPCIKDTLQKYDLKCWALSSHLTGQCVGDIWDPRLNNFAPSNLSGNPVKIHKWAVEQMKKTAEAACLLGVKIITGFTGSPIWSYWYSYPQTTPDMIENGFQKIYDLWSPILDVFDEYDIKFAFEIHPAEIAFDYYSTQKLLEMFHSRNAFGINFDPSHLVWQGVNELTFLRDFKDHIYHVHMKDVKINKNEKASVLGSHLPFGDTRRGWNFVSVGHGNVDFDGIIRELNSFNYTGPLSIEWEDSGMDRMLGIKEAYQYVKKINFISSEIAFDSSLNQQ